MSARIRRHLLSCLSYQTRQKAVEAAIERGFLASMTEDQASKGVRSKRVRVSASQHHSDRSNDNFFRSECDDDLSVCHVGVGPLLAGRSRHDASRILGRCGIHMPLNPDRSDPTVELHVDEILRVLRLSAPPPPADEIAVMLLLVPAVEQAQISVPDLRRMLRQRSWSAVVLSSVDGAATRLRRMLEDGAFGRRFSTFDADGISIEMTELPSQPAQGGRLIVFHPAKSDRYAIEREEQAGLAARFGHPVIGIADQAEDLPLRLQQSANLSLILGPLTSAIVSAVMREVHGGGVTEAIASVGLSDEICASLSLYDLAAAIRPGRNMQEMISALRWLAGADDNVKAQRLRSSEHRFEHSRNGNVSTTKGRNGRKISTGSEIILPVKQQSGGPSATDDQSAIPTIETLHGYGPAKEWALDLKSDLSLWRAGTLPWEQMSSRLLLSGPPGTGKTSFARALCNTLQVPLLATSVSTWLEPSHLGDVIQRMRLSFEEALSHKPCILFIDEIDGIGKRGFGSKYDDYWNAVVNKLLELLDGASKTQGIIIVGATNHPENIDTALRRSGRLETHIEIPLPDTDALIGILAHHLGNDFPGVALSQPKPLGSTPESVPVSDKIFHHEGARV